MTKYMQILFLGNTCYRANSHYVKLDVGHPFGGECSCPSFHFRKRPCKHILHIMARLEDNMVGIIK